VQAASASSATSPVAAALPSQRYAYYVLFVLSMIFVLNWIDRMIISILLVPIQQELQVSDTAMGLLSGFGFSMLYALSTIPIARYSDRHNRRNLLAIAVTVWSVATSLCGLVAGYGHLLLARALVGVAEAGGGAPSYSLISDYFEPRRRAFAMGVYSGAIYIGIMLSLLLGSLLAERFGWRTTFLMLGPPGLLLALVLRLTVHEPLRGRFEPPTLRGEQPSAAVLRFLFQQRAYLCVTAGLGVVAITLGGFSAWVPAFLVRVHGLTLPQVGLSLGLVLGTCGAIGTFSGGWLSDRLSARNPRVRLFFPATVAFLTTPFFILFCFAEDLRLALVFYAIATIVSGMHFGPAFGLTQNLARPTMRGLATALVMVSTVLTGQGAGPLLTGLLSDVLRPDFGPESMRYALAIMACFAALGAMLFAYGARFVAADIERATGADLADAEAAK
jgi:predicted MFS family arabinose efflux permease